MPVWQCGRRSREVEAIRRWRQTRQRSPEPSSHFPARAHMAAHMAARTALRSTVSVGTASASTALESMELARTV
jgi:alkylation response protein AidB-like acyl-CoA dehydrogenase